MSILRSKHSGWTWEGRRTPFGGGSGGGGSPAPQQNTTVNTNVPEYAKPYVEAMLGAAQKQAYKYDDAGNVVGFQPYVPYGATVGPGGQILIQPKNKRKQQWLHLAQCKNERFNKRLIYKFQVSLL